MNRRILLCCFVLVCLLTLLPSSGQAPPPAKSGGEDLAGRWEGATGAYRTQITVTRDGDRWQVEMLYLDGKGDIVGAGHGERVKLSGATLSFFRVLDRKPERQWLDTDSTIEVVDGQLQYRWSAGGQSGTRMFERAAGDAPASRQEESPEPIKTERPKPPGDPSPAPGPSTAPPFKVVESDADDPPLLIIDLSGGTAKPSAEFTAVVSLEPKPVRGDVDTSVENQAAISAQGNLWALYRRAGVVELRSLPADELLAKLTVKGYVDYLEFSADGKTLAVGTHGGEQRKLGDPRPEPGETAFFDIPAGTRRSLIEHPGIVVTNRTAALSPDGEHFAATARRDDSVKMHVWKVETQELVVDYDDGGRDAGKVAFSADGKKLALAGKPVLIIDVGPGKRREMESPGFSLSHLAISPDGKTLALAGSSGEIALINTSTGKVASRLGAYQHSAGPITFTAGGKLLLASGATENAIRAYDTKGEVIARIPVGEGTHPIALSATADGRYVLAKLYGVKKEITIWSTPWGGEKR